MPIEPEKDASDVRMALIMLSLFFLSLMFITGCEQKESAWPQKRIYGSYYAYSQFIQNNK